MSTEKHSAIVLKNYFPQKYSLSLLDHKGGKMTGVSHAIEHISVGSLIEYTLDRARKNSLFIYHIELQEMPFVLAQSDILFLHHALELCYHFIPNGSEALAAFELLKHFYVPHEWMQSSLYKKIFLFKLFVGLGIYPEDKRVRKSSLQSLATNSFMTIIDKNMQQDEQDITAWLRMCVSSHHHANKFKTIHFLDIV